MPRPTPEDLAEFVSLPTPRDVPPEFASRTKRRGGRVLMVCGGIFLVVGLVFAWFFFPGRWIDSIRLSQGTLESTRGTIVNSSETNYSEGGGDHSRGTPIHLQEFRFEAEGGQAIHARCYEVGRAREPGAEVAVEYLADDPDIARIRGGRLDPFGLLGAIVLVFPLVGFLVMFFPWRARRGRMRLLRDGVFTFAKVLDVKRTAIEVNQERRYIVTLELEVDGAPEEVKISAYGEDARTATKRHEQGEPIGVLHDPRRPRRCFFTARLLGV